MSNLTSVISGDKNTKIMVNHIIFLIDMSASMSHILPKVKSVFDETLRVVKSTNKDQTIKVSVYQFSSNVTRLIFDTNINDIETAVNFNANGMTRLKDCIVTAIEDHSLDKIKIGPNEDHTFLVYVLTDGEDNMSITSSRILNSRISKLNEDWTFVALVPDIQGRRASVEAGIPEQNIKIWETTNSGVEEVGQTIAQSYQSYTTMRSMGIRSTSNIFAVDASDVKRSDVRAALSEVAGNLYHAQKDYVIRDMVEKFTGKPYQKGSTFYELEKTELVQSYKEIVVVSKKDDKKFGGAGARQMLNLPTNDTKIKPGDHGDWRIFVQSTSVNRKIKSGTSIFVKA